MIFKKIIAGVSAAAVTLSYIILPEYHYEFIVNAETDDITYSEEFRSNDFGYRKVDEDNDGNYDYVTITDFYDETATEIVIPNKIDGLDTKGIENFAFWRIENKLSVIFFESLDSNYIKKFAFITSAVTYQNAVVSSGADSLEGVLKYYLNDYGINYTDEKVDSYVDYAKNIVMGSERDFDINSLSVSQFLTILFDEINLGKISLSDKNINDFRFFLNTFSYKKVELLSYYARSNIKNGYAKSKVALKYKYVTPASVPNAGVSISNTEIKQGDKIAVLDINLDNTASKGLDFYIYCNSPIKINEISNAKNTEYSTEYGDSCIHGKINSSNDELLKNNISSVTLSIPENAAPGIYPVYIEVINLKNENGIFINEPISKNGSVIINENENIITTSVIETTVSANESEYYTSLTNVTTLLTDPTQTSTVNDNFVWGKDNWHFNNSSTTLSNFEIDSNYSDTLRKNTTNIEWTDICNYLSKENKNYSYGMSVLEILSKNSLFPYSKYTVESNDLFSIESPEKNNEVYSLLNYYTCLQFKNNINQYELKTMLNSHESNIKNIISQLQISPHVLVEYQNADCGKHAVAAYDVVYGDWEKNGITYDGRINIYDPDSSEKYDENRCIYFNKATYKWSVPAYDINSLNGAVITLILSDISILNNGGFINGTEYKNSDDYYSKLEIINADESYKINKVTRTDNNIFVNAETDNNEIIAADFYNFSENPEYVKGYILKDSGSGYKFSQITPAKSNLNIRFKDSSYNADVSSCSEIIFDPIGYVSIKGKNTKYSLNMIFDENYPTDWYQINISAADADSLSLKKSEKGYFMYSDRFDNVSITANNDDNSAKFKFSTEYKQVYVYEINKTTIGVSVDTDNDGIYETKLDNDWNTTEDTTIIGDISGNGVIDIYDAIIIAESLVGKRTFTDKELIIADINCDGKADLYDAIEIATRILHNK